MDPFRDRWCQQLKKVVGNHSKLNRSDSWQPCTVAASRSMLKCWVSHIILCCCLPANVNSVTFFSVYQANWTAAAVNTRWVEHIQTLYCLLVSLLWQLSVLTSEPAVALLQCLYHYLVNEMWLPATRNPQVQNPLFSQMLIPCLLLNLSPVNYYYLTV